jgi:hypothetical protein
MQTPLDDIAFQTQQIPFRRGILLWYAVLSLTMSGLAAFVLLYIQPPTIYGIKLAVFWAFMLGLAWFAYYNIKYLMRSYPQNIAFSLDENGFSFYQNEGVFLWKDVRSIKYHDHRIGFTKISQVIFTVKYGEPYINYQPFLGRMIRRLQQKTDDIGFVINVQNIAIKPDKLAQMMADKI